MPAADFSLATRQTASRGRTRHLILALAVAVIALNGSASMAAVKPKPASPPPRELVSAPLPAGADKAKLDAVFDIAQADLGANQALVVLQKGSIVFERYVRGYEQNTRLNSWSAGGAITAALVGRAVKTGAIKSLDEPAGLTEWKIAGDGRQNITIRNLLAMNSGLSWKERAAGSEAGSDADKMLFGIGQRDVLSYAAAKKSSAKPGERFVYSTGSSVLLSAALQRRLPPLTASDGKRTYALQKFMNAELFDKLGMSQTAPQFDAAGNFYASLIWMNARDLAKFGEFCLRDGVWNKERLLPEGWIQTMRTPSGAKGGESYGAGFWIKAKDKPDSLMASLQDDSFAAGGDRGQVVVMIPSKDLVIVRLGLTTRGEKSRAALGVWLGEVAAAFP